MQPAWVVLFGEHGDLEDKMVYGESSSPLAKDEWFLLNLRFVLNNLQIIANLLFVMCRNHVESTGSDPWRVEVRIKDFV